MEDKRFEHDEPPLPSFEDQSNANIARCNANTEVVAVHPCAVLACAYSQFWKWTNFVIAATLLAAIGFYSFLVFTTNNPHLCAFSIEYPIFLLLSLHCWRMFVYYSKRLNSLRNATWVMNHIPAKTQQAHFQIGRRGAAALVSIVEDDGNSSAPYELFCESTKFRRTLEKRGRRNTVLVYCDPVTKQPVALETSDREFAILKPPVP
jgi:hypothetical protein